MLANAPRTGSPSLPFSLLLPDRSGSGALSLGRVSDSPTRRFSFATLLPGWWLVLRRRRQRRRSEPSTRPSVPLTTRGMPRRRRSRPCSQSGCRRVMESDGARYQGRDLIERSFTETFEENKGAKIVLEIGVDPLPLAGCRPRGRTVHRYTGQSALDPQRDYEVLFVKRENRWLISSVREEAETARTATHDRLQELSSG